MAKLDFEDVRPYLFRWAIHYSRLFAKFEVWELINDVWANGGVRHLPKDKIRYASNRIRWDMICYIRSQAGSGIRCGKVNWLSRVKFNSYDIVKKVNEVISAKSEISRIETKEFFDNLPAISKKGKLILMLRFIDGLTLKEIGQAIGYTESRISQKLKIILNTLKSKLSQVA